MTESRLGAMLRSRLRRGHGQGRRIAVAVIHPPMQQADRAAPGQDAVGGIAHEVELHRRRAAEARPDDDGLPDRWETAWFDPQNIGTQASQDGVAAQ